MPHVKSWSRRAARSLLGASLALTSLSMASPSGALAEPVEVAQKKPGKAKIAPGLEADAAAVKAFIEEHTRFAEEKNIAGYLGGFVPNHPERKVIPAITKNLFERFDFEIEIEDYELAQLNRHTARVVVIQRTLRTPLTDEDVGAHERARLSYTLRKVNKKWKIVVTDRDRLADP